MTDALRYWQTLEELEAAPAAEALDPAEPPAGEPVKPASSVTRRDFFRLMGLSAGAAALACKRAPVEKVVPFTVAPDGPAPGVASWYATACRACAAGCGLLVKVRDGRPIKIEGNPLHPHSQGGVCAVGQASVLGVYDADRLRAPVLRGHAASWAEVDGHVAASLGRVAAAGGAIRVVAPMAPGPAAESALSLFVARHPTARVVRWEPTGERLAIAGAWKQLTGVAAVPRYRFDRARVVASFDADFLGAWLSPAAYTRQYAAGRRAGLRHWQLEPTLSLTGSNADRRVPLAPSQFVPALSALLRAVVAARSGRSEAPERRPDWIQQLATELVAAQGAALVVCGSELLEAQRLAHAINLELGAVPNTLQTGSPTACLGDEISFGDFVEELVAGRVAATILVGVNPVYSHPRGAELAASLARLELSVAVADRIDETAAAAAVAAPASHFLESWGDTEVVDGFAGLQQPAMRPLWDTREAWASVLRWSGVTTSWREFIEALWRERQPASAAADSSRRWHESLQAGFATVRVDGDRQEAKSAARPADELPGAPEPRLDVEQLELVLYPTPALRDGTHANNAWLQELPDPITKARWTSYACVAPALAAKLGLAAGRIVRVSTSNAAVEAPVLVQPGLAPNVVAIAVGYGRWRAGSVGNGIGANAFALAPVLDGQVRFSRTDFELRPLDQARPIPLAQVQASMGGLPRLDVRGGEPQPAAPTAHGKRRWGMLIDLAACTGCSACVISCQAENNIPAVGPEEARRRRDLHWLRIDRYYEGPPDNPRVVHQPVACQHCGHAPCERVCPVLATAQSSEGLNQQVYARCIGSRACSATCPVKARRFNWLEHPRGELERLVLNPDVVVRSRGVMEKCSLCGHRIEEEKARARAEGRVLRDGDVRTACQQSCPAQAIVFGDLADPSSQVSRRSAASAAFQLLPELPLDAAVRYASAKRGGGGR